MPIVVILCLIVLFRLKRPFFAPSCRSSILLGLALAAIGGIAISEILSAFGVLTPLAISASWELWALILLGILTTQRSILLPWIRQGLSLNLKERIVVLPVLPGIILGALLCFLGILAWNAPPNTYDALTYHLARVAHWAYNQSLAPYPTHISRQLSTPPGAEILLLQLHLLTGGDKWDNLLQFVSMLGCLLGVSLITRQLGGNASWQLVAAFIAATLPIGILEATSTQTDYVMALWVITFVSLILPLCLNQVRCPGYWAMAGFSLTVGLVAGVALLTKGTAYIYLLPFGIWLIVALLRQYRGQGVWMLLLLLVSAFSVNAGFFNRNIVAFGFPLVTVGYINTELSAPIFFSNLIRNLALHVPLSAQTQIAVVELHRWLGWNVANYASTFGHFPFILKSHLPYEDTAACFPHLLLLVGICGNICFLRLRRIVFAGLAGLGTYLLVVLACGGLLCLLLKWQVWGSRLHLAFFVLMSPVLALMFFKLLVPPTRTVLYVLLAGYALPFLIMNLNKPLLDFPRYGIRSIFHQSRTEQYFANIPRIKSDMLQAIGHIHAQSACRNLGLFVHADFPEYPLHALLCSSDGARCAYRIESIWIQEKNRVGYYPRGSFDPCLLLVTKSHPPAGALDNDWQMLYRGETLSLYRKTAAIAPF